MENFSPGKPVDPAELAQYLPPTTSTTTSENQPLPEEFTLKNGLRVLLLRDRQGFTYGIYSAFVAGIQPGPFLIQMQTDPNDTQKAIASTIALLKQVREQGITEAELNTAKRSITNSYPVDLANPSDVADLILKNSVYGLSLAEIKKFPQQIDAVNMAQVQQVIKDLIHPEHLVIVTAGPGGNQ